MEQLATLGVELGDQDSAAKSLTALKNELAEEKLAWEMYKQTPRPSPRRLKI